MAYIRKYREGWRAEVQRHGIRVTHTTDTKREAQAWALQKESELDSMKRSKGLSFGKAALKYLTTVSRDKAEGATEWEERRFAEMGRFLGDATMLSQIDSARIGEWRDHRVKQVSASTVLRERNLLRSLFQTAVDEWKVLQSNPFNGVRFPDHNPPRHQLWTWKLIKRVMRAEMSDKEREAVRAFHISLHTALRMNEVVAAKLEGRVAVLPRDKTSGNKPVKVPLARKGAELFAKYPPFTLSAEQISPIFSDLTDKLLIDGLTYHDSRASALTWLSRRYDVMTLARISRHRNLKTLMDSYYRETAEQIAARL
jgi:integrase